MIPVVAPRFKPEQDRVEALIRAAFAGVTREGGISWAQSILDDEEYPYESPDEPPRDNDTCWEDLLNDPHWNVHSRLGGLAYLDAIGWRYYIAPAMIRSVHEPDPKLAPYLTTREWTRGITTSITAQQALAIIAFLRLMCAISDSSEAGFEGVYLREYFNSLRSWQDSHGY